MDHFVSSFPTTSVHSQTPEKQEEMSRNEWEHLSNLTASAYLPGSSVPESYMQIHSQGFGSEFDNASAAPRSTANSEYLFQASSYTGNPMQGFLDSEVPGEQEREDIWLEPR